MTAPENAVLAAKSLTCGYPNAGRTVLRTVDLGVKPGRFLCIIGPNGAGKTTLLRTLAGLLPPIGGRVELGGRSLASMHANERARRLSVVLTRLEAPGYLTVGRFVELGRHPYTGMLARLSDADREAVAEALTLTGMRELRHRWMAEISDGERQRAAVARALAQAGDAMILDEPTAFLDVAGRASIMTTLRRIAHRTGRAIVTTSHDIELVLRTADSLVVIDGSGALTTGSPEDLILRGAVARLFPDPSLVFDPRRGSFRLPHPTGSPVRLVGRGLAAELTAHALERIGRPIAQNGEDAPHVEIVSTDEPRWRILSDAGIREVTSLEELAELLRE